MRIDGDPLIAADGARLLSSTPPRTADGIEKWMATLPDG